MGATAVPVTLRGAATGAALVVVGDDGVTISAASLGAPVSLPFAAIDGIALADANGRLALTLFVAGGDAIDAEGGDALRAFAAELERRATALPELTRALRAVGTRRGGEGTEHDRFFVPLLDARARAERATGWAEQVEAFAPERLRAAWADAVAALCAERYPDSAPDRRALDAALEEALETASGCLGRVGTAAAALREADDGARLRRWRRWVDEVARLFVEADRCWLVSLRELADAPAAAAPEPRRGVWERMRRRS